MDNISLNDSKVFSSEELLQQCEEEVKKLQVSSRLLLGTARTSDRRKLYAKSELLAMRISALTTQSINGGGGGKSTSSLLLSDEGKLHAEALLSELSVLADRAQLVYSDQDRRGVWKVLSHIEEIVRLLITVSFLMVSSTLLALPCLVFFAPLDHWLVHWRLLKPHQQVSVLSKRFTAYGILKLSGIHLVMEEDEHDPGFGKDCSLICFSHSSTLDAFILSAVMPVRHYTLVSGSLSVSINRSLTHAVSLFWHLLFVDDVVDDVVVVGLITIVQG
jgi:hypothetical protein